MSGSEKITVFFEQLSSLRDLFLSLRSFLSLPDMDDKDLPFFVPREKYMDDKFDEHTKILMNKTNVIEIKKLTDFVNTNEKINISPRVLLSAWTIVSFPNYLLDMTKKELMESNNKIKINIYISSMLLTQKINDICKMTISDITDKTYDETIEIVKKYKENFEHFLEIDKIEKISELVEEWLGIGRNIVLFKESEKYNEETFEEMKNMRDKIEKIILSISSKFIIKDLYDYEIIYDRFEKTMKKVYRDKLIEQLTIKNYEPIIKIMKEINEYFDIFMNISKSEIKRENILNIDLLIKSHTDDILTIDDVVLLGDYLVKQIELLQSPSCVIGTREKWDETKFGFRKSDVNIVIIDFFLFILRELTDIKENIINLKILMSFGINPFE